MNSCFVESAYFKISRRRQSWVVDGTWGMGVGWEGEVLVMAGDDGGRGSAACGCPLHVQGRLQVRSQRYIHSRYKRYNRYGRYYRYTDLPHAQLRDPCSAQGGSRPEPRTQDAGPRWGAAAWLTTL